MQYSKLKCTSSFLYSIMTATATATATATVLLVYQIKYCSDLRVCLVKLSKFQFKVIDNDFNLDYI